jgi:hypothetical protein
MTAPGESPAEDREARLAGLAATLGLELPVFEGPLAAFRLVAEGPVFLGGDLHAVHPEAAGRRRITRPDPSLDSATIVLTGFEDEALEALAVCGIWCIRVEGELLDAAPYFSIFDAEGRPRTWLLLPQPRLLVDLGHLWLPAVAPMAGR